MWEQLPCWQGYQHPNYAMTADIEYWDGSAWQTLTTTYTDTEKIRLTRDLNIGNGDIFCYIDFEGNQQVRLNSAINTPGSTNDKEVSIRNIQIKVSDTNIKNSSQRTTCVLKFQYSWSISLIESDVYQKHLIYF